MNVRAGSPLTELENDIKKLEDKIYVAKTSLPRWEEILSNKKKEYEESKWMKSEHPKEFGGLYISSNWGDWEDMKEKDFYTNNPFYIHTSNPSSLSMDNAKELIQYLQQKIDYLECE